MYKRRGVSTENALIAAVITVVAAAAVFVILKSDPTGKGGSKLSKEFVFSDSEYRRTDPALIHYREVQRIETNFQSVRGLTVGPDDRIYIAGDRAVKVLGSDGKRISEIAMDDSPRCLAVSADGTVYVGMTDYVEVHSPQKPPAKWSSLGEKADITSIAISGDNVFVADSGNSVVLRYDSGTDISGKIPGRIGRADKTKDIPGLLVRYAGVDVAAGAEGVLWVTNPGLWRVEAYSFDGDLKSHWGRQSEEIDGFCGCCNPTAIALLPGGAFVTVEKGLPRVKVYDDCGLFVGVVAGPESFPAGAVGFDLAVDSQGRIMVLDTAEKAVRIFTLKKDDK
ncbi:MAG: hypothetical protein SVV80_06425 [Planctomycetota bacterium]|nr:hypothetical protein [Planctomycetota bacterium]